MPLTRYQSFSVCAVVALDEHGDPIPPSALTEVPVVTREITGDDDPNASAFGIYGILPDQSFEHVADCPSQVVAEAIANLMNIQCCFRRVA